MPTAGKSPAGSVGLGHIADMGIGTPAGDASLGGAQSRRFVPRNAIPRDETNRPGLPPPSPPTTLSSIATVLRQQHLPRPGTITVGSGHSRDAHGGGERKQPRDFSHGFSRIGIDNEAPLLFENDQRHLLTLAQSFSDIMLDGELLLLRTRSNRSGSGGRDGAPQSATRGALGGTDAVFRHGGANFLMKASSDLVRANMLNLKFTSGAGGIVSPLSDRYETSEVLEELCGLPPQAAISMRFRLSPWRSLFERWISGMLEERRPEPKHVCTTRRGVDHTTSTDHAAVDLAWKSVRPARVHSMNVDPVLQLELLVQCAFRVADLKILADQVPTVVRNPASLLATSLCVQPSMGMGTPQHSDVAATVRQQAVQTKAHLFDRMIRPPQGVPHLICTATTLFALQEHLPQLFGPACAPLVTQLLKFLIPLMLDVPSVRSASPELLTAAPLNLKSAHPADFAIRYVHCTIAHDFTQKLALRRIGVYRMRDKVVLRQHQDRAIFSSIKAIMRRLVQSLFQQWRAVTRRHRSLKIAVGSLLVIGSDREVMRRGIHRWLFTSKATHYDVDQAVDAHYDRLQESSTSTGFVHRLAQIAAINALPPRPEVLRVLAPPLATEGLMKEEFQSAPQLIPSAVVVGGGRRLSSVVVEDADLGSTRGASRSGVTSRAVPDSETPAPHPLTIFAAAASPAAFDDFNGSSQRLDACHASRLGRSVSAAASPLSSAAAAHPIRFPFSPLMQASAKMSMENLFTPMLSPRGVRQHPATMADPPRDPDALHVVSVREGISDPFNASNPAALSGSDAPPGTSTSSMCSPRQSCVAAMHNRFNASFKSGTSLAASPSAGSSSNPGGGVFDPKTPAERHRRLAMVAAALQSSVQFRNKMLAGFEYTDREMLNERLASLEDALEAYHAACKRIGSDFRSALDYLFPLIPSPLLGNTTSMEGSGSGDVTGAVVRQDIHIKGHPSERGQPSDAMGGAPGDEEQLLVLPGQRILPIDMKDLASAGSEAKKSLQRVQEAETAHLLAAVPKKRVFGPEGHDSTPRAGAAGQRHRTSSTSLPQSPTPAPPRTPQGRKVISANIQDVESEHDKQIFRRQERIFHWLMHLAKHDVGTTGPRLRTFLNRCCNDRSSSLTLSVVGRTSHLLPLVRLTLMSLAPPSLPHFELTDLFTEGLLQRASTSRPQVDEGEGSASLSLKFGQQASAPSESSSPTFVAFAPVPPSTSLQRRQSSSLADAAFSVLGHMKTASATARRGSQRRRSSVGFLLDSPRPEALMPELREEQDLLVRRESERTMHLDRKNSLSSNAPVLAGGTRRRTIQPAVAFTAFDSEGALLPNDVNNSSPSTASLLASSPITDDLNAMARRVSSTLMAQNPSAPQRKRSLATKLEIVTLRAVKAAEMNAGETFSQQYRRMSQQPLPLLHDGGGGKQQPAGGGTPSSTSSKVGTPANTALTPSAGELKQQASNSRGGSLLMDASGVQQVLRRKSIDLYQNKSMDAIGQLEAAALTMVKEHRKGFFHPGAPDPMLADEAALPRVDEPGGGLSLEALGTTDEERELELTRREEDALMREEEQQVSAISEEVERVAREQEMREVLKGLVSCCDATSLTHLVLKLMNRLYVHNHQQRSSNPSGSGGGPPEMDMEEFAATSAGPSRAGLTQAQRAHSELCAGGTSSKNEGHQEQPSPTLIRVFPQALTRHMVLKHKNWRHLFMAALYFTQVGPTCMAFRNVYCGLEARARRPLKALSTAERREVLLGKAPRVSYLAAASCIPEHDPSPTTPQQMHHLFTTRKNRKREQLLDVEEANALTMYHDSVRDISLKSFYGIGLTTTAGQLYDQFCAASADIAEASIIMPSFLAAKMKIVFGPESSFWRPVTSVRSIRNSVELEEMLTTLAPLGRITSDDLCDRLLASLDDTDLFYISIASPEVEDAYTACFPEVSVVFSLYASCCSAESAGEQKGCTTTPKVSFQSWMTMNDALYDVNYSPVVAEMIFHTIARRLHNKEAQEAALAAGRTSVFQLQQVLMVADGSRSGGGGMDHHPQAPSGEPGFESAGGQRRSDAAQGDYSRHVLEQVSLDLDSFCDAISVMASMKFPSPFTPLEQKIIPFVQTLLVPLAGSKSKDIRRRMHVQGSGTAGTLTKDDLRGKRVVSLANLSPELRAKLQTIREKQRFGSRKQQQRLPE